MTCLNPKINVSIFQQCFLSHSVLMVNIALLEAARSTLTQKLTHTHCMLIHEQATRSSFSLSHSLSHSDPFSQPDADEQQVLWEHYVMTLCLPLSMFALPPDSPFLKLALPPGLQCTFTRFQLLLCDQM